MMIQLLAVHPHVAVHLLRDSGSSSTRPRMRRRRLAFVRRLHGLILLGYHSWASSKAFLSPVF